ncbi:IS3 family transposase, partial [Patescibacteria group bacterium]|nr:IS3 family transposase [Patescibacteria group bacterium]
MALNKSKDLKINSLCSIARVSSSGYYYWLKSKNNKAFKNMESVFLIKTIFENKKGRAGFRTIKMILNNDYKMRINHKKIIRIMREDKLICTVRRRNPYKNIMKKQQENRTYPNLLDRKFNPQLPNEVYSTDITYLPYGNNKSKLAYLSSTKDLGSKEIVYFNLSKKIDLNLALDGIKQTLLKLSKKQRKKLMIHSDQGVHYTHPLYSNILKDLSITQSMSRKATCIDNAPIESFFGHMKDEVNLKECESFEELKVMIENYIDFYNNKRYQWNLKKMTPVQYRDYLLYG